MASNTLSMLLRGAAGLCLGLAGGAALAEDSSLNLPRGVTSISNEVYDLHMLILWICVVIGIVVFGAMFWSILHHRKSKGHQAAQFHESTTVEIIWTIIPFAILVGMAIPATRTLIAMEDTTNADMTVKITGFQWKWRYDYLEDGISFHSNLAPSSRAAIFEQDGPQRVDNYLLEVDNEVVLPVNKKVRLLLTADDVIHAWWVPKLGMKRDAIPGFINEMWTKIDEPGVYRGQCAELCGKDHGFMPIVVRAVTEDEYRQWVEQMKGKQSADAAAADKPWSEAELLAKGKDVYLANCAACHQNDGQGVPDTFPAIAGSKVATGPLEAHLKLVREGRPGTAMQAFGKQLSAAEIAAVVTYQRNAFGNATGDLVQPADVLAAR